MAEMSPPFCPFLCLIRKPRVRPRAENMLETVPTPSMPVPNTDGPRLRVQPEFQLGLSAVMFLSPEALELEAYLFFL